MFARILIACVLISSAFPAITAAATSSEAKASEARELRYHLETDLVITSLATIGWGITRAGMDQLAPSDCRWCGVNAFDDWGHRNITWSNTKAASRASDLLSYGAAPLAAYGLNTLAAGLDDALPNALVDALLITEATALAQLTTQFLKIAVGRQRPYAHYGTSAHEPRENISFPSGHTSLAFALATSSGTIATMRGYRYAPLVWGTGLAIAATTSYLRIAAEKHYLTDTIAGAVIGSAIGIGIPYLFHRPERKEPSKFTFSAQPTPHGGLLSLSGLW